jgi:hypothetical protein
MDMEAEAPRTVYLIPPEPWNPCEHWNKSMGEAAMAPKNVYMMSP